MGDRNRYDAVVERMTLMGYDETVIREFIEEDRATNAKLDQRICPRCGEALTRKLDPRQVGAHVTPGGLWYNYRCGGCRYMLDRVE